MKYEIHNNSVIFQYCTFWVINLPGWIGSINPSREIIILSITNSTGGINLEHMWHFIFSIYTMLKNYFIYEYTVNNFLSSFTLMQHISWLINGFFDTITWSNPSNPEESFWTFVLILATPKPFSVNNISSTN